MIDGLPHLIRLRPRSDTLLVSQGRTVFASERDGFIYAGPEQGLFVYQTRMLSHYRFTIDGKAPSPVALSNVAQHTWLGYYVVPVPGIDPGPTDQGSGSVEPESQQTLEMRISRYVGFGVHEDIDLTNFSQCPTSFTLALELEADFADQAETLRGRQQRGELSRDWREGDGGGELEFRYTASHPAHEGGELLRIDRGLRLRFSPTDSPPRWDGERVVFRIDLPPRGRWHACIFMIPRIEGLEMPPLYGCHAFDEPQTDLDRRRVEFLHGATRFRTPQEETLSTVVSTALQRAKLDLASLRLYDLDRGDRAWTMAAGLPVYLALYGRDTLTAAWQAALTGPEMMTGTLHQLARWQGQREEDWRDEAPGRMLHEAHTGPLAMLDYNPRSHYYGASTTSGFYAVVVGELWHWTGDADLVRPFLKPALEALRWLDSTIDPEDGGFYWYRTRSSQGTRHQGWKDSSDAIVHADGRDVPPPIATCEEQGFVYLAKLWLSEVLWWLDEKREAVRLFEEARTLKRRFNRVFWMEQEGFYAMGLDPDRRPIRSIGSNPGHCLATGIVETKRAARTASRLLQPDLFSGWGVRTLSADHPAYNPFSYHRGSIWPVEQGTFALAFMRYGLHDAASLLVKAQLEAAMFFDYYRLPEAFGGHARDREHPFPAIYPRSNWPQAWSSSALFSMLQAMLGLYPYAPMRMLLIDPHLPPWLPEITLEQLRVGDATVTIRFYRKRNGRSSYKVLDRQGKLHVVRQASPWSLTSRFAERLKDALSSLAR